MICRVDDIDFQINLEFGISRFGQAEKFKSCLGSNIKYEKIFNKRKTPESSINRLFRGVFL